MKKQIEELIAFGDRFDIGKLQNLCTDSIQNLDTLDLSNKQLNRLPSAITCLTALKYLNMSHNQLESIPQEIYALPSLKTIDISWNHITKIPDNVFSRFVVIYQWNRPL